MKTLRHLSIAVFAVGALIAAPAQAGEPLSPCAAGEIGAGTNCMFLTAAGAVYNPATGDRSVEIAGMTVAIDVWIDFGEIAVQGGGFDIAYDTSLGPIATWEWSPEVAGDATLDGFESPIGYEGIQFDDFLGSGWGGSTGTRPGKLRIGTLTVMMPAGATLDFDIVQPYTEATFPNCFAPGAGEPPPATCVPTNFYGLQVNTGGDADTDGDGVPDLSDNCIFVANADQRDTNEDGFGNICDGDFNDDCSTNIADLAIFRGGFLGSDPDLDLNGIGGVNIADLSIFRGLFLGEPGPSGLASCP